MSMIIGFFEKIFFGQPWHGVWKGGKIKLPNGEYHTCPIPNLNLPSGYGVPKSGSSVFIKIPNQPEINRTQVEQSSDISSGKEWRNYALISGGVYGSSAPILGAEKNKPVLFFIDNDKKRWLIKIYYKSGILYMQAKKFGIVKQGQSDSWSVEKKLSCDNFLNSYYGKPENFGGPSVEFCIIAQNSTGSDFVIGDVISSPESVSHYCRASTMYRYKISGSLNINYDNFGLDVNWEMIECPGRLNINKEISEHHNGKIVITHTAPACDINGLVIKEVLIKRQTVTEKIDGHETLIDGIARSEWYFENPDLLIKTYGWSKQSDVDKNLSPDFLRDNEWIPPDVFTSVPVILENNRNSTYRTDYVSKKYTWATYKNDELILLECVYKWSESARTVYYNYIDNFLKIPERLVVTSMNESTFYDFYYYSISEFVSSSPNERTVRTVDFNENSIEFIFDGVSTTKDVQTKINSDSTDIINFNPPALTEVPVWSYEKSEYLVDAGQENYSLSAFQQIENFKTNSLRPENVINITVPSVNPIDNVSLGAQCIVEITKSDNGNLFKKVRYDKTFSQEINTTYFPFVTFQPVTKIFCIDNERVCFF